jgi:hypothetical protein
MESEQWPKKKTSSEMITEVYCRPECPSFCRHEDDRTCLYKYVISERQKKLVEKVHTTQKIKKSNQANDSRTMKADLSSDFIVSRNNSSSWIVSVLVNGTPSRSRTGLSSMEFSLSS